MNAYDAENIVNITRMAVFPLYGADDIIEKDSVAFARTVASWATDFEAGWKYLSSLWNPEEDYFTLIDEFTERKCAEHREALGLPATPPDPDAEVLRLYRQLHDGISDMLEGGRLEEGYIPDDYAWLVDIMTTLAGKDEGIPKVPNFHRILEMREEALNFCGHSLENKYGPADYPEYPREAWAQAAADRQTDLGYWEWVFDSLVERFG